MRARRRTTIPAEQLTLAIDDDIEQVWANAFIVTNLDLSPLTRSGPSRPSRYRHRADIEDRIRDAKYGAALRHLPSGNRAVNIAWMWGLCSRSTSRPGSTSSPASTMATATDAPTSADSDAN